MDTTILDRYKRDMISSADFYTWPSQPSATRSTIQRYPARLPELAQELFDMVIELVEPQDLQALRLASRECFIKTITQYREKVLSRHSILLCSDRSIAEAVQIAKTPLYGRCLTKLSFFVEKIIDDGLLLRRGDAFSQLYETSSGSTVRTEWEKTARAAHERIRASKVDLEALTEFFTILKGYGNRIEIELVQGDDERYHKPKHFDAYRNACCTLGFGPPSSISDRPLRILLKAILASQVKVKTLSVDRGCADGAWVLPIHVVSRTKSHARKFGNVLQQVEKLDLAVWAPKLSKVKRESQGYLSKAISRFTTLLAEAPQLKSLALHLQTVHSQVGYKHMVDYHSAEPSMLTTELLKQTLPTLETLYLHNMTIDLKDLVSFTERHHKLQKLSLEATSLSKAGLSEEQLEIVNSGGHVQDILMAEVAKTTSKVCRVWHTSPALE